MELFSEAQMSDASMKFMGIYGQNNVLANIIHIANMYQSVTTVAFYLDMKEEAMSNVIKATSLKTIATTSEYIQKLIEFKKS